MSTFNFSESSCLQAKIKALTLVEVIKSVFKDLKKVLDNCETHHPSLTLLFTSYSVLFEMNK